MRKQAGFTVAEALVTIAIVAILLGVGVPSLATFIQNSRMISSSNGLVAAFQLARTESLKRRQSVSVQADGESWADGWEVFVDENADLVRDAGADDVLLQTHAALSDAITINSDEPNLRRYVIFSPQGFPSTAGLASSLSGSLLICDRRGNQDLGGGISAARVLTMSRTGRPQTLREVTAVDAFGGEPCPEG